jgi:hypothetical protein
VNTKAEWWSKVDDNWNDLLEIIYDFALDRADEATTYMLERNPDLARVFNSAWFNAPDDRAVLYSYPGWGLLCDLCSEEWVLYDDEL